MDAMATLAPAGRRLGDLALQTACHPVGGLRSTARSARSAARLLAPAPHPLSELLVGRSIGRRYEVLDLDPAGLRGAGAATGATVNDLFVAGVLGGLARYHEHHATHVERLRVLMPVNVRRPGHGEGGNHFVPARFALALGGGPAERLREVHRVTETWKHAPGLALSDVLAAALDRLPPPLVGALWGTMLKGDDFVATNVPGPTFETYLAGARVERFYAFAPPSGAALNVALVTPAGRACVGISVDSAAVPDTAVLARCLASGFDEVLGLAGAPPGGALRVHEEVVS